MASSLCLYQHVSFHRNYRAWLGGERIRRGTNWSCAISWQLSATAVSVQAPVIANCPHPALSMLTSCSLVTHVTPSSLYIVIFIQYQSGDLICPNFRVFLSSCTLGSLGTEFEMVSSDTSMIAFLGHCNFSLLKVIVNLVFRK